MPFRGVVPIRDDETQRYWESLEIAMRAHGLAIMPVEPTEAMQGAATESHGVVIHAAYHQLGTVRDEMSGIYSAMLAASPFAKEG